MNHLLPILQSIHETLIDMDQNFVNNVNENEFNENNNDEINFENNNNQSKSNGNLNFVHTKWLEKFILIIVSIIMKYINTVSSINLFIHLFIFELFILINNLILL